MLKWSVRASFYIILLILVIFLADSVVLAQENQQKDFNINSAESDSALVQSYLGAVDEAKNEGEVRRLRNILGEAHRLADSLANPLLLQTVEKDLGEYYLQTGSYDSAQVVLERAAERSSDRKIQIQVLNYLATAYRYQSKFPEAMNTYNQGLSLVDSLENPDRYAALTTNKAAIYENLGNLSEAISLLHKGINFAETAGDSSFLATALNNVGNLYSGQEDYGEAKTYLTEAIAISEEMGFHNTLLRSKHNLANSERDHGNYDEARNLYQEVWSLHEKMRPGSPPIQLLYNMGLLHLYVSELDEAEEHFRESLEYSQEGGVPAGIFHNFIGLGDVVLAGGDLSASIDFYNEGFKVANKVDSPPFRITVSEKLYEAYKKSGNFEQALKYHELAKSVSDSLVQVQQDKQLALAETELGLRQEQKINQLLQERQDQQEARIQAQNWLIIIITVVLVVILVSLYLLYRSNKERKRINKELEELNEVKNKMMGVIAHDLRSPMASMQGILYLLRENNLSEDEIKKMASHLEVSINNNISMMDNLLAWARGQMSGLAISTEIISARDIVERVIDNLELQVDRKGIKIVNKVNGDLSVNADRNLLQLILRNLISNSIKFSHNGDHIVIKAREKGGKVVFEVQDTGIGIPKKVQQNIFKTFNESRSGTDDEKGSGLGLRLCKEFVEKQGGDIDVESAEGEGSTFYVSLPKG